MGRLTHLSISLLSTLCLSQGLTMNALAADQNTYRPGQAYLKTAAQSHDVCAQQCQGDAQCRGWNFVRPNPRAATGICEFNARVALPVASAISISGEVSTSVDPLMSRAIPAGTNTRRVGTPSAETRKATSQSQRPTQVKRMPVPTRSTSLRPTAHTNPAATAPNARQSRVYGSANPAGQAQGQAQGQTMTPQQLQYRQQFLAERQRQEQMRARQQAALRQQQMQRPHMMRPPQPAPGAAQPQFGPQFAPQAQQMAPQIAPQPQPLYGSLHDDLTKDLTPVARPKTTPDNLSNPDAPVSTSRAVPAEPVETTPLKSPVIPGLAGANQ